MHPPILVFVGIYKIQNLRDKGECKFGEQRLMLLDDAAHVT